MASVDMMPPAPPRLAVSPKPRMTIYIVLLILSLVAILVGCLFLYLEIRAQGGFGTVRGSQFSSATPPAQTLLADAESAHLPALG